MKSYRKTALIIASALTLLISAGCSTAPPQDDEGGASLRIAFFNPTAANSFLANQTEGVESAAKELGAELTIFDANGDANTQLSQIQSATSSQKFDGFVITPLNGGALVGAIQAAADEGIEVVCVYLMCNADSVATENTTPGLVQQIGVDFAEGGRLVGEAVTMACADLDPCQVAYVPGYPAPNQEVRRQGFLDAVAGKPNIQVVASEQSGEDNATTSLAIVQDLITAHASLDVIALAGDTMAGSAESAITAAGKTDQIAIVSLGGSRLGYEGVKSGAWFAEVAPDYPFSMGSLGVHAVADAHNGKEIPDYVDAAELDNTGGIITKENVETFKPEWSGK